MATPCHAPWYTPRHADRSITQLAKMSFGEIHDLTDVAHFIL